MLNVCPSCGDHGYEKPIKEGTAAEGYATATCPSCGHEYPFRYRSLLSLTGAPGSGKSTVVRHLSDDLPVVGIESDMLIDIEHETDMSWNLYCGLWLRVCILLHSTEQQVLLAGSGIGFPENITQRPETRYFSQIHRCALVCDEAVLEERLKQKSWLKTDPERYAEFLETNRWFFEHGPDHGIELVNTTDVTVEETVQAVEEWVNARTV